MGQPDKEKTIVEVLTGYLKKLDPGRVEQTIQLERLLANVWGDLGGEVLP